MLDNYLWALKPNGQILTDQRGMDWAYLDPAFILTYQDLKGLEKKFPVRAVRITERVYSIQAIKRVPRPAARLHIHALRDKNGTRVVESHVVSRTGPG